jgi:hypothetical protein
MTGGKSMRRILGVLSAVFGFVAWVAFMGAALGVGAEIIHWLESTTWEALPSLADAWPALGSKVAAMKWLDGQRVAYWVIAQPMTLIYAALGFVCLLVSFILDTRRETPAVSG